MHLVFSVVENGQQVLLNRLSQNTSNFVSKFKLIIKVNGVFYGIIKISTEKRRFSTKLLICKVLKEQILALTCV